MNTVANASVADMWGRPDMRAALHERDIKTVYRILQRHGWTQRKIAAVARQSQSEVSEILKGRQVLAYPVLVRIAEGLLIPRGWMGLAYADGPVSDSACVLTDVLRLLRP